MNSNSPDKEWFFLRNACVESFLSEEITLLNRNVPVTFRSMKSVYITFVLLQKMLFNSVSTFGLSCHSEI